MKQWKIWLGLLLIFGAGLACGSAGTVLYVRHRIMRVLDGGPAAVQQVIFERLSRRLQLTRDQRQQIAPIAAQTHQRLSEIRRRQAPQAIEAIEQARGAMEPFLDPAQREILSKLAARFRKGWESDSR